MAPLSRSCHATKTRRAVTKPDCDEVHVLSIGAVIGGTLPTPRAWKRASNALSDRVQALRVGVESPLNVNVVFQIPGEVLGVDFVGVRTGRYTSATRHLLVQAAVPRELPEDPVAVLRQLMTDAIDEAARYARRKNIADDLPELRAIVAQL
jgi:hypothetical protein